MTDQVIASWSSRGGRWGAILHRIADTKHDSGAGLREVSGGYRIAETKHGCHVGAAFRPFRMVANDAAALAWGEQHVADCFDVKMIREED